MQELFCHLIGDYLIQNEWMALNKKKEGLIGIFSCAIHSITYCLPFLLITSLFRVLIIAIFHYIVDRTHIVEKFIAIKNNLKTTENFGFPKEKPEYVSFWLYVVIDNTFHLLINHLIINF